MQLPILALLSVVFAAPVPSTETPAGLQPAIYMDEAGSLYIAGEAKEVLLSNQAQAAVRNAVQHSIISGGVAKREALDPKINFCFGRRPPPPRPHRRPCEPIPEPCEPIPEPCYDPCYDPCADPYDNCCGDDCGAELRASCYTKWFCPSTYLNCGQGICPEDPYCHEDHPVVDSLRNCCATRWMCPSAYCPSNWGCGGCDGCGCDGYYDNCGKPCVDPCAEPCPPPPCEVPCDPCY